MQIENLKIIVENQADDIKKLKRANSIKKFRKRKAENLSL